MDRLFIIWLYLTIVLMIILKVLNLYSTIIILLIFSGSLFLIILISIKYLFFIFSNLSLLFSIAAFLTAIYNNETDTFSIYLLNIYMLFAFLLVIAFFIINITVTYWKKYHDELYIEIENNLLYIYLNFDKYFNNNYNSKIKYMINRILKN